MMTDCKLAFSYVRLSTAQQLKGDSLRRQADESAKYAKKYGLNLVESLEDVGMSAFRGAHLKAGALGQFVDAVDRGKVPAGSVLLIESLDRLSRQEVGSAFNLFTRILEADITIITLQDDKQYTQESINKDFGELIVSLGIMFRANEESATKSRRIKAAWQSKRDQASSKILTSIAPAWLEAKSDKSGFDPISSRAGTVQKIFELSISGFGSGAITSWLNKNVDAHPPFSNRARRGRNSKPRWHKSYVQKILNNPAVYGDFQPHKMENGERIPAGPPKPNYFPEVVSKRDFLVSKSRLASRRVSGSGRKGKSFSNLFTRIAYCGECGATIGFLNKGVGPKGGSYLRCMNSQARFDCNAPAWRYEEFEQGFFKLIFEVSFEEIVDPDKMAKRRAYLRESEAAAAQEIEQNNQIYENLLTRLGEVPDNAYRDVLVQIEKRKAKIDHLETERAQMGSELAALSQREASGAKQNLVDHINELQESLCEERRKELRMRLHNQIRTVVDRVEIHNNNQLIPGDDVDQLVPEDLIEELAGEGVDLANRAMREKFFYGRAGQSLIQRYHRHFSVKFKNGSIKTAYPDRGTATMSTTERMAEFARKVGAKSGTSGRDN